jgi:hypothetical protein
MRDYLATLFWWNNSQNYLWYPVDLTPHSNNDTTGSRLINNMMFPHIWLAQNNITYIKRGNITHYLILEGIYAIRQVILLADTEISSLVKPQMLSGCECDVVNNPNYLTTSTDMRFFWLSLSTMKCNVIPFTHICEWQRHSPSSGSTSSSG